MLQNTVTRWKDIWMGSMQSPRSCSRILSWMWSWTAACPRLPCTGQDLGRPTELFPPSLLNAGRFASINMEAVQVLSPTMTLMSDVWKKRVFLPVDRPIFRCGLGLWCSYCKNPDVFSKHSWSTYEHHLRGSIHPIPVTQISIKYIGDSSSPLSLIGHLHPPPPPPHTPGCSRCRYTIFRHAAALAYARLVWKQDSKVCLPAAKSSWQDIFGILWHEKFHRTIWQHDQRIHTVCIWAGEGHIIWATVCSIICDIVLFYVCCAAFCLSSVCEESYRARLHP